jgi:hypothetical protein
MTIFSKLDLEFIKPQPFALSSYSWIGLTLFLSSLILATFIWQKYHTKQTELIAVTNQLTQLNVPSQPKNSAVETAPALIPADKKIQIETIVSALVMPWNKLLQTIEHADTKDIALLNLAPNTKSQQIILSGEGKNLQAVLNYTNQLQAQPMLEKVYLQKYTIDTNNVSKPVKFTIFTQWRNTEG